MSSQLLNGRRLKKRPATFQNIQENSSGKEKVPVGDKEKILEKVEIADTFAKRLKGAALRQSLKNPILFKPAYLSVHTFGMKFALDIAFLDSELRVLKVSQLKPYKIAVCWKSRAVLEAEQGSFQKWGIVPGIQLKIKNEHPPKTPPKK